MCDMYVPLSRLIREEGLLVNAIKLSVVHTAVFHLYIIWYCDETTIGQVSESSEGKAKPRPRRTH